MEIKTDKKTWHSIKLSQVLSDLNSSEKNGLTDKQVFDHMDTWGKNTLPHEKKDGAFKILLRQFTSPLVYILLIASILTFWLHEYTDMVVILIVVIVNASIGFYQEYRAGKIFEKLQEIVRVKAIVVRDGKNHIVNSEELVPGDLIILKGGSKVPADARLISTDGLQINEAVLTGESMPVTKSLELVKTDAHLGERKNMLFMGTVIEEGEGRAVVVSTGADTEIGKISLLTQTTKDDQTPLQIRVGNLGKLLTKVVGGISVIIFTIGILSGHSLSEMLTTSIAVAVAAIPEGLPAAISVILAVASQKILKRKGLVRKLVAAETLGSTSVICTDKTGTLTYGQMKVEKMMTPDKQTALQIMALSNEAVIEEKDGEMQVFGEATDKAKMESFLENGGNYNELLSKMPRVAMLPFDSDRKYLASFNDLDGKVQIAVTGAPETLIALSDLTLQKKELTKSSYENLAQSGYRVIAVARAVASSKIEPDHSSEDLEKLVNNLDFLGLVALRDPIRDDVKETLKVTREAGIKILMITGDHLLTARAIGQELGFSSAPGAILLADELDTMSDKELQKQITKIEIIARATPTHKMRIIDAWQYHGAVVAMTGDGVNDAPALKSANIGVAIGSGTEVTKEASDLVLLDDSFSTITAAVRQGRIGFENIKKVSILLLTNSFSEIILILTALIFALPFPITAVQILWVNLVEDSLPVLALAFEPGEEGIMKKLPIKVDEKIVDNEAKMLIFAIGLVTNIVLVGVYLYMLNFTSWEIEKIRTFIFASIGTDTLLYIFAFKSLKQPLWKTNLLSNKFLLFASGVGFSMLFLAIYVPILNKFLGTVPLSITSVLIVFAFGGLKLLLVEVIKWRYRVHSA